jgi:excisionase family DNA binding protein
VSSSPLLKTEDVAERFQVTRSTVARWVASGDLVAVKTPGGRLRFRPEDVERLFEKGITAPVEPTEAAS